MILAPDQPFTDPPCLSRRASSTARFDLPTPVVPQIAMRGRNVIWIDGCVKHIFLMFTGRITAIVFCTETKFNYNKSFFLHIGRINPTLLQIMKKWPSNEQEIKYDVTHYVSHGNTGINGKWVITAQQWSGIIANKSQITICSENLYLQDS